MNAKIKLLLLAVAIFAFAIGQVQAATVTITVPNADFETIYKPDSTTITATLSSGGWTQGVGPDCPIDVGRYNFSDQTTGSLADIPGWLGYDRDGWIAWGGSYGRSQTTGNLQGSVSNQANHTSGGLNCYLANGGSWSNPAGGLIVSDASLGNVLTNATYTLSMYAKGGGTPAATPVALKLLANGTVITPSSSVSPTLSGSWQEFSRTYDAEDLTGYVGQALTIVCGVDRNASGTQTQMDDVSLTRCYEQPALPALVVTGAVKSGTGAISPALPSGIAVNDILLLFVETANQAVSISNQNGGTWAAVTGSPQGTGTAGGTSATRLTVFWSRYNGTQGAPTVSDSGNHQAARMIAIRGAVSSGNPWDVTAGGVEATSDTSASIPGATTTVANTLVVVATAGSLPDANGTAQFSAWTNANLTSLTERTDNSVSAGNGGSLGIATGIKATAGAYGNTAATRANSAVKGMISIAIKP